MKRVPTTCCSTPAATVTAVRGGGSTGGCSTPIRGRVPFLLSGGIDAGCADAVRGFAHPRFAGVDLNSGFETAPAVKDAGKLEEFIAKIQ